MSLYFEVNLIMINNMYRSDIKEERAELLEFQSNDAYVLSPLDSLRRSVHCELASVATYRMAILRKLKTFGRLYLSDKYHQYNCAYLLQLITLYSWYGRSLA